VASMLALFPERAEIVPEEAYVALDLEALARDDRPYVIANMVTTADGRATLSGSTKAISSDADRIVFHNLREQIDAVLVGTGTIAIERYGPLVRDPERRKRRVDRGRDEQPLCVTASRSLELPVEAPLFGDPESRIVVLTGADKEAPSSEATVTIERVPVGEGPDVDLARGMQLLRERYGVRSILLEGGPTLLSVMLEAGLVDELFLTVAPLLTGGGAEPSITEGPPLPTSLSMRLVSVLEDEGFLFVRYGIGPGR
jgi:riboflavin-specific deaminase-like protein